MELDTHAEDLASDLGVDKAEVKDDLENLVAYSVPIDEAKRSLRRKYGEGQREGDTPSPTSIDAVTTDTGSVTVTVTVLTVGRRRIQYRGDEQVIREGTVADETGRLSFTAWEDFDVHPGDTVTIGNASVREWDGRPELNIGEQTTIESADASLDVEYPIGGESRLAALEPGDRGRNLDVRVLEVESRTIDGRDGETDILSGVVGDESGRLPFTDWEPHNEIESGESVRLENVYVREFRGVPSVNVSEFSTVSTLEEAVETGEANEMRIRAAVAEGGVYDVALSGNVIDIRDGSGLVQRCPECGRVIQKGQCRTHGDVEGEDDLRVKAVLDDGTGTVTVILDDEQTERIYGGDVEDAREAARDAMDQSVVAEDIAHQLVGGEYSVRGHLSVDEYGSNVEATRFEETADDPGARARSLLEEVHS